MTSDWKAKAESKRQAILESIPTKWRLDRIPSVDEQKDVTGTYVHQFLTEQEITITETDAVGIASTVASGKWSAVEVTTAFCHRASIAHQLLNCLHETFFDAALADAEELDAHFAKHGTKGPLHGVPVSLKDQFHVKDVDTTMGYVGWIDTFEGKPVSTRQDIIESEMVRELRECGAILYCKTSVPHTLMSGETINNIIGYTWNPKNRHLTSGGSSGGEGALIGFRGSPLGLGTDIGGSVRIPAGFNGLYGLRPSSGRIPYEGVANSMDGQGTVLSVVGPIATTAGGIRLMVQSLLSRSPWLHDPMVVEMPWRKSEEDAISNMVKDSSSQKLAFGVMKTDGVVNPTPPVARAVDMVTEKLVKAGHEIIEWKPPSHSHGFDIVLKSWLYDGGRDIHSAFDLSGETPAAQISVLYGDKLGEEATATQIAMNNIEKRRWQKDYMEYWNSTAARTSTGRPVDGLICPLAPHPATTPGNFTYYAYSGFVNGLDYTSVVLPVTTADQRVDRYPSDYQPVGDNDRAVYEAYDPEITDGAHVNVQIVGRRYTEEKMIAIADYVGSLLEGEHK